jgi:hypothetical protein
VYIDHCVEDCGSSLCDFADDFLFCLLGSYFFFFGISSVHVQGHFGEVVERISQSYHLRSILKFFGEVVEKIHIYFLKYFLFKNILK